MTARLKVPFEAFEEAMNARKNPAGFVSGSVMRVDDGVTVVGTFIFESKEAYAALAELPDQGEWFSSVIAPMLDGDATWLDGHIGLNQ
jgi:hypothetical protein